MLAVTRHKDRGTTVTATSLRLTTVRYAYPREQSVHVQQLLVVQPPIHLVPEVLVVTRGALLILSPGNASIIVNT